MTHLFVLLYCLVFTRVYAQIHSSDPKVQEIWKVLDAGEKQFTGGTFEDVILVVGNTGAGKSTLTQFLFGRDAELISKLSGLIYTIEGSDAKNICSSTFDSCTQFPELTIDVPTRTPVWDNPGFSDTRGAANEIAATYFTHRLLSSVRRIKIVCVVPFDSMKEGGSRDDFPNMVSNVAKMVPNIEKFAGSIAVVITKVDNIKLEGVLVDDGTIVEHAAEFMAAAKTALLARQSSSSSGKNSVKLIDILLTREGSFYPRIGLFRRPKESGPLSAMPKLQEEKAFLREMILGGIVFTPASPQDFRYVVADKWKEDLRTILNESKKTINSDVKMIGEEVKISFKNRVAMLRKNSDDPEKIIIFARNVTNEFASLKASVSVITFEEMLAKLGQICQRAEMPLPVSKQRDATLLKYNKFVEFISSVSGLPGIDRDALNGSLTGLVDYLNGAREWYSFLDLLHGALGSYGVQKDIKRYSNGTGQLLLLINEGNIRPSPFHTILHEVVSKATLDGENPAVMESYHKVKNVELDEGKLEYLNYTLAVNLNYVVTSSCKADKLVVSGNFIRANDIITKLRSCARKFVEVFAAKKIFIDRDIDATGKKLQLSIIAPTWEVIGGRQIKIIMDGSPGASFLPPKEGSFQDLPGSKGRNGKAGRPGGAAGGFFGIGEKCIGCDRLLVLANGGSGGNGQDGGDGRDGEDGDKPAGPYDVGFSKSDQICGAEGHELGGNVFKGAWTAGATGIAVAAAGPVGLIAGAVIGAFMPWELHCYEDGRMGQRGGQGGRGGAGGYGGPGGELNLIFAETVNTNLSKLDGRSGKNGSDGVPGKDGSVGYRLKYLKETAATWEKIRYIDYIRLEFREPLGVPEGESEHDDLPAAPEPGFAFTGLPSVVERYVSFAKGLLPPTTDSALSRFLRYMESIHKVAAVMEDRKKLPVLVLSPFRGKRSAVTNDAANRDPAQGHKVSQLSGALTALTGLWPRLRQSNDPILLPSLLATYSGDHLNAEKIIDSTNLPQSLPKPAVQNFKYDRKFPEKYGAKDEINLLLSSKGKIKQKTMSRWLEEGRQLRVE